MNQDEQAALWQSRAKLILQVQAGKLTAKEAARQMGVSRKTYYEWEKRALAGMAEALSNGKSGRPGTPRDPDKEKLQTENKDLKRKLVIAEQTQEVRDILRAMKEKDEKDAKKKHM
jgi:transposase